jgi:uncharacterized membrane protein
MEITLRGLVTAMHGIFFGSLFLLAAFAAFAELIRSAHRTTPATLTPAGSRLETGLLVTMAALGWAAVLSGTYLVYPWYRAAPPAGTLDLTAYPRNLLLAHVNTAGWHSFGMEWKEHIGWIAPIVLTMLAFVLLRETRSLQRNPRLRNAVIGFAVVGLFSTAVAGLFGAMLDKAAPVQGGQIITLQRSAK